MTILLVSYFTSILMFGFVGSAISYCLLLVFNSLCCLGIIFLISGFSWYAIILYLVYVGGVYILFLFVSVHLPNNMNKSTVNPVYIVIYSVLIWELVVNLLSENFPKEDFSMNFCSGLEGGSYLFLCSFLLLGFYLVSVISSSKESFIR